MKTKSYDKLTISSRSFVAVAILGAILSATDLPAFLVVVFVMTAILLLDTVERF